MNNATAIETTTRLIEQLRQGDKEAFDMIYRSYFPRLCAYASQYVPFEEAEELVQDTLLWLWENRETLNASMSTKSLLFVIVKNKALNSISHRNIKLRIHQNIIEKYELESDDPNVYMEKELNTLFCEAMNKMPLSFKETFEMNRFEGLTHKEIAERMNVSFQTVNYRIGRVLKTLRESLKDYIQ